jgi:ADP-ribose pyrophosphatase YjhB (NUDIX family)
MIGLHVAVVVPDAAGRVLLVRQGYGQLLWSLPGGAVERHESPASAAVRETLEETGHHVELTALTGVYAAPDRNMVSLVFLGATTRIDPWHPTGEISHLIFAEVANLPTPMSERMRFRIADALAGQRSVYRDDQLHLSGSDMDRFTSAID